MQVCLRFPVTTNIAVTTCGFPAGPSNPESALQKLLVLLQETVGAIVHSPSSTQQSLMEFEPPYPNYCMESYFLHG